MSGQPSTDETLGEIAGILLSTTTFDDLTHQIAELAARMIPAAATCGITLAEGGRVVTVAAADSVARLLDEQQYDLDEGPCLEALDTRRLVSSDDLTTETRWGEYPKRLVAHDICSMFAAPLIVIDVPIGALNLYARSPNAFDPDAQTAATQLARLTATIITAALRHFDEETLTDHLRTALASRSTIDQAIGIVMATQHCSPEDAFDVLRGASQHRNVPLRQVAEKLVSDTIESA